MLGKMPAMLRGILEETFAAEHDITVVGAGDSATTSVATVRIHHPDVLVVGVEPKDWSSPFVESFVANPRLRVLAIREDGRSGVVEELAIRRWRIPEVTPRSIVAAVRASLDGADELTDLPPTSLRQ
jgi:chemotaxis response regulator CheB